MITSSDNLYAYHFNATGSTIAMTDENQDIANKYAYTPFGIILGETETIPQPFKYIGQYGVIAEPTGLYYMRARFYDPYTGRFISQDPLGFDGGDINLYVYAANNPIMVVDPYGQAWSWAATGAGSTLGIIGGFFWGMGSQTISLIKGQDFNWNTVGRSTIAGAAAGAATGVIAGALTGDPSALLMGGSFVATAATAAAGGLSGGVVEGILTPAERGPVIVRKPMPQRPYSIVPPYSHSGK